MISKKARDYIEELLLVGKKYGLSLAHEDTHGCFTVEERSEYYCRWLSNACEGLLEEEKELRQKNDKLANKNKEKNNG